MVLLSLLPSAPAAAEVGKKELECILMRAMSAAKNVGAQRDRLVELRRRLQQRSHRDEDADGIQEEVASGLHKVYSKGIHYGARYLETAAKNCDRSSFSIAAFAVIPDEQLYGWLLGQWHFPRPTTKVEAFARIESAYYAVKLSLDHHLSCCIELLVGVRPPPIHRQPVQGMIRYADDLIAAANEHLRHLASRLESGLSDSELEPAPAAAAATGMPPREKSSVDLDHALSYLHRSCSLTNLAVKHINVAIAFISSSFDPEEVAKFLRIDRRTYILHL